MTAVAHVDAIMVELGGESLELKLSARALVQLSNAYGGLRPLMGALQDMNVGTVTDVLAVALRRTKPEERDTLQKQIFDAGLIELLAPVTRYVSRLGGAEPSPAADATGGAQPPSEVDVAGDAA